MNGLILSMALLSSPCNGGQCIAVPVVAGVAEVATAPVRAAVKVCKAVHNRKHKPVVRAVKAIRCR